MKIKKVIKNRSHRHDIHRPRPRQRHKLDIVDIV